MNNAEWITLPWLHPDPNLQSHPHLCALWPGLPGRPAGYWQPDCYPYSCEMAEQIFNEISSLTLAELESLRLNSKPAYLSDEINFCEELNSIAEFAGNKPGKKSVTLILENAHKLLLLQWFLEITVLDIHKLEMQCVEADFNLASCFTEPGKSPVFKGHNNINTSQDFNSPDFSFAGNWKLFLANSIIFIPESKPVFIDSRISPEILDHFNSAPNLQRKSEIAPHGNILSVLAPLWEILGHSQRHNCGIPFLDDIYNKERQWLIKI